MSDYKYAYKIQYEIIPVLNHDGYTFPELSIKYYRRGKIFTVTSPAFQDVLVSRPKQSMCKYAIKDFEQPDHPWIVIPQHPIDIFAHRMYPSMYPGEPLDKMSYYQRIKIFSNIVRGYFDNDILNYVKAVARDFILIRYVNFNSDQAVEWTARRWYTTRPEESDICMTFTDYAVTLAKAHCPDFTRTIIKSGAIDPKIHEVVDKQEGTDYKTYVFPTNEKEVSIIEEDILQPLRSGIAVARNRQPKDRPVPDN